MYPSLANSYDARKRERNNHSRSTMKSTNFRSVPQRNNSNVTNHYFNTPSDGSSHGHVKEQLNSDGSTSYPYIRDVEGNEYDPV